MNRLNVFFLLFIVVVCMPICWRKECHSTQEINVNVLWTYKHRIFALRMTESVSRDKNRFDNSSANKYLMNNWERKKCGTYLHSVRVDSQLTKGLVILMTLLQRFYVCLTLLNFSSHYMPLEIPFFKLRNIHRHVVWM